MMKHKGPAICFDKEEDAMQAALDRKIKPGHVVIVRYEGPKGGPGMRRCWRPRRPSQGWGFLTPLRSSQTVDSPAERGARVSVMSARRLWKVSDSAHQKRRHHRNRYPETETELKSPGYRTKSASQKMEETCAKNKNGVFGFVMRRESPARRKALCRSDAVTAKGLSNLFVSLFYPLRQKNGNEVSPPRYARRGGSLPSVVFASQAKQSHPSI